MSRLPWRWILLVLLLLALAGGGIALGDEAGFELLRENRALLLAWRDGNLLLTALGYIAGYAVLVALSVPGSFVMTVAGGFLFGLVPGTLLSLVAGTAGATAIFLAARSSFGARLRERWLAGGEASAFARMERRLKANELSYLLLIRLVPAVPFPLANVAPAFFGVSARRFAVTTFVGITPGTAVTAWIGVGVGEVFDRGGTPDLGLIAEPHIALPLAAAAALAALPLVARPLRARLPARARRL